MMSNGPPPARLDDIDDARWIFPQEQAPPPRNEGYKKNGFGDPALHASNGSPPTPSPPSKSSSPSSVSTSFPTLVTMGRIAPTDACPPATLTEWRFYASQEGIDGTFMVNLRSGERLWRPPDSVWDLEWDIGYKPNPEGTWYRVPGTRRWVLLDIITCWIHDRPTARRWWYLVEDTAQPIACARPPLPHQIELILAKLTLRRMTHSKRGSVAKPVESGRSLSPNSPRPISYVAALLSPRGGGLRAVVDSFSVDTG